MRPRHVPPKPCSTRHAKSPCRSAAGLPGRSIVLVLDSAFAALEFLAAVRGHACVITRLRLDANLFAPAPPRRKGPGRPPLKGKRLPKLAHCLADPATHWQPHTVALWYGRTDRRVEIATGTAVWYHAGLPPVPIPSS
jgi:hypothetical protein